MNKQQSNIFNIVVLVLLFAVFVETTYIFIHLVFNNTHQHNELYLPCASLSSTFAIENCQSCIDAGDYWIPPEGCISRFNPKSTCKDIIEYDKAKECLDCISQGNIWMSQECQ